MTNNQKEFAKLVTELARLKRLTGDETPAPERPKRVTQKVLHNLSTEVQAQREITQHNLSPDKSQKLHSNKPKIEGDETGLSISRQQTAVSGRPTKPYARVLNPQKGGNPNPTGGKGGNPHPTGCKGGNPPPTAGKGANNHSGRKKGSKNKPKSVHPTGETPKTYDTQSKYKPKGAIEQGKGNRQGRKKGSKNKPKQNKGTPKSQNTTIVLPTNTSKMLQLVPHQALPISSELDIIDEFETPKVFENGEFVVSENAPVTQDVVDDTLLMRLYDIAFKGTNEDHGSEIVQMLKQAETLDRAGLLERINASGEEIADLITRYVYDSGAHSIILEETDLPVIFAIITAMPMTPETQQAFNDTYEGAVGSNVGNSYPPSMAEEMGLI